MMLTAPRKKPKGFEEVCSLLSAHIGFIFIIILSVAKSTTDVNLNTKLSLNISATSLYSGPHTHTHTSTDRCVHDQCKVASVLGEWWSVDMKGKRDQELAFMIDQRVTWQPGEDFLLDRSAAQMDSATYHGLCVCVCLCVYNCIKRKTSFPKTGSVQYPMECLFLMPCSAVSVCLHLFSPHVSKSTMCLKHPRRFWNEGLHSVPSEALLINSAAVMGGG